VLNDVVDSCVDVFISILFLIMKIENVKSEKLIPYEFNNKIHDETQVNRIANSIREF
jgi:hypothetical protein